VTQALLNQPQQQPPQQTTQNVGPGGWPMPNELRPADVNRADKGDYLGTPRSSDPNAPAQPDAYPQIQTGGLPLGQVPSVPLPPPRPPAPPAPAPSLPPAPQPPPPPQRAPLPPNAFQGVAGPPQGSNEIVGQPQSPYNQPNSMQALQNFLFGNMRGLSSLAHQRPVGYNYGSPTAALIRPPAGYRHPAPKKPQSRSGSGKKKSEKDRERHRRDEQRDEDRQSGGR
jgi:hypothetical protein